jgi:phage terminase large subunit-like protein
VSASATAVRRRRRPKTPTRRRERPPDDPVTDYARAVQRGAILVGRAVRLACDRHLRDLERQDTPAFPYGFDAAAAQHIIDFFPAFLTLETGAPFTLTPWLQFCLGSLFGWKRRADGGRRFQIGYIETGKGSGKTPTLAGVGVYVLVCDPEPSKEIYAAGFDRGQASILVNDGIRMASTAPDLAAILDIGTYNIANHATSSFFRAVSSEHRSKSGPRPYIVLVDEVHEHRDGTVITKMRQGFKGRWQPLLLEITNAGHDRTSICWTHHQHSLDVLEGTVVDEQWFAYVCQLDACEPHRAEGYRQPKDGCAACDDWTDPAVWPKVNPSLGVTISLSYLQTQVDIARHMPSEQALVKRLNFCLWTETHEIWIPADQWDACRVPQVSADNAAGRPAAAGLDLSSKIDLSGLTIAVRFDDPPTDAPSEIATIDSLNDQGERVPLTFTLNFSVELIPFAWIPEETLLERVTKERIPYDVWVKSGHLLATPGPVIDHQAIYDFIVQTAFPRFKLQRLGYDPWDATMLAVQLRDRARLGDRIVAVGQGKKLSEATKLTEVLVRSRRLRHDGHPVLGWNVANAERKRDRLGASWIEKPAETKRIDLAVAAIMAIHQLLLLPVPRKSAYGHRPLEVV